VDEKGGTGAGMGKMKTAYNIPVGKQLEKTISDM
jgi:hypothetical protein